MNSISSRVSCRGDKARLNNWTTINLLALFSFVSICTAEAHSILNELQQFSVKTGATRVIYYTDSVGTSLTVMNPQSYPILVQSEVLGEDKKSKAPFIVTPPLFRLESQQQSRIRLIAMNKFAHNTTESLHWLCLTGIPPEPDSDWIGADDKKKQAGHRAKILTQLRVKNCLKLLVRPSILRGVPEDFASSLAWTKTGQTLTVTNPTPFYMNLKDVSLGKQRVDNLNYVPPMGNLELKVPANAQGPVHWRLITDYGGDSREFTSQVN